LQNQHKDALLKRSRERCDKKGLKDKIDCENLPAEWNIESGEDFVSFQPLLVFDVKLKAGTMISL
jgi:hypothetical protein